MERFDLVTFSLVSIAVVFSIIYSIVGITGMQYLQQALNF